MSHPTRRHSITALALGAALVVPALVAAPAMAKDEHGGNGVNGGGGAVATARSACAGTDGLKLKAKHDDGRLEVELEVDTDVAGQVWTLALTDDGSSIFSGTRTTGVGGLHVEVHPADRVGADVIRAVATRGSRVCTSSVTLP